MWFIGDAARLERERAAVVALVAEADWLQDVDWRLTADGRIRLDFSIVVGEQRCALRMTYPSYSHSRHRKLRLSATIAGYRSINMAMQRGIFACSIVPTIGCRPRLAPTLSAAPTNFYPPSTRRKDPQGRSRQRIE
jgi:hypothetical protein